MFRIAHHNDVQFFLVLMLLVTQKTVVIYLSFRSVAVITFASHAKGRRFEPGRKHLFFFFFRVISICFQQIIIWIVSKFLLKLKKY
jgi:hypothetical protein